MTENRSVRRQCRFQSQQLRRGFDSDSGPATSRAVFEMALPVAEREAGEIRAEAQAAMVAMKLSGHLLPLFVVLIAGSFNPASKVLITNVLERTGT